MRVPADYHIVMWFIFFFGAFAAWLCVCAVMWPKNDDLGGKSDSWPDNRINKIATTSEPYMALKRIPEHTFYYQISSLFWRTP